MKKLPQVEVRYNDALVGLVAQGRVESFFQFDPAFLKDSVDLSPISTPRRARPYISRDADFHFLPPFLADSLPDRYGMNIMERWFRKRKGDLFKPSAVDMLGYVGQRGLGALTYHPSARFEDSMLREFDLHQQEKLARAGVAMVPDQALETLRRVVGSAGGSYPKALLAIDTKTNRFFEDDPRLGRGYDRWIIKFGRTVKNQGGSLLNHPRVEHAYHRMAAAAGIATADTTLVPSTIEKEQVYHFMTRRFDVLSDGTRRHMLSLSALTGLDAGGGALDYRTFLAATHQVTGDVGAMKEVYRRMVFNVLACNGDDHGKNHAFLFDGHHWALSPAYDLTFYDEGDVYAPVEHSLAVNGERTNIRWDDVRKEGEVAGLDAAVIRTIFTDVLDTVARTRSFAAEAGVPLDRVHFLGTKVDATLERIGRPPTPLPRRGQIGRRSSSKRAGSGPRGRVGSRNRREGSTR